MCRDSVAIIVCTLALVSLCSSQRSKSRDGVFIAPNNRPVQSKNTTIPQPNAVKSSKNATAIALKYCEKYDEYKYRHIFIPPQLPGEPGQWLKDLDCSLFDYNLPTEKLLGLPKEFPHMGLLGYGSTLKKVEWNCVGSLVSEKFILSSAYCSTISKYVAPKWVLLGDLDIASSREDAKPAIYEIVKIYIHPNYDSRLKHNNLALFELNATVTLDPHVRPICLHTSISNNINTRSTITGWGQTRPGGQRSDHLLQSKTKIIADEQCKSKFNWYNSTSMICAQLYDCVADSGSPLVKQSETVCMWNLLGVMSNDAEICIDNVPRVFTNVAFYLDWIQSIVWP